MILLEIFYTFFKIGSLSIGGAYSFLPLIEKEVVQNQGWLGQEEFLEVVGMVQIFPGAISIKYATYTGYKVAGIPGAIMANLGNMITPAIIIIFAAFLYEKFSKYPVVDKAFKGIQFAVIGLIATIVYQYAAKMTLDWKSVALVLISAALILIFKMHPAIVIALAAVIAIIIF